MSTTEATQSSNEPQKANIHRDTSHIEKRVISNMEFISIQDEQYREYDIMLKPEMELFVYAVMDPQWLYVRPSGAHMVLDADNVMHYIKADFLALRWKNHDVAQEANF